MNISIGTSTAKKKPPPRTYNKTVVPFYERSISRAAVNWQKSVATRQRMQPGKRENQGWSRGQKKRQRGAPGIIAELGSIKKSISRRASGKCKDQRAPRWSDWLATSALIITELYIGARRFSRLLLALFCCSFFSAVGYEILLEVQWVLLRYYESCGVFFLVGWYNTNWLRGDEDKVFGIQCIAAFCGS